MSKVNIVIASISKVKMNYIEMVLIINILYIAYHYNTGYSYICMLAHLDPFLWDAVCAKIEYNFILTIFVHLHTKICNYNAI